MAATITSESPPRFKRVLLKVSGEVFTAAIFDHFLDQLDKLRHDIEFVIVVGGGNVFRGGRSDTFPNVPRTFQDHIGMCASLLNGLILKAHLLNRGIKCRVFGPFPIPGALDTFDENAANADIKSGKILIMAGGLGQPYLTTDTTAVLSALKTKCDIVLKGTKVDGLYEKDPFIAKNPAFLKKITHKDVLIKDIKAIDGSAIALAQDFCLPIRVFNIMKEESIYRVLNSQEPFTHIDSEGA